VKEAVVVFATHNKTMKDYSKNKMILGTISSFPLKNPFYTP
jgi:hypothetical protein